MQFLGTIAGVSETAYRTKEDEDKCDLIQMASSALNYLRGNPDPVRAFECKFTLGPLGIPCHLPEQVPPNEYGYDPISLGDTDARMAMQYPHMREMVGHPEPEAVEKGVTARVMGYLHADHYAWINPAAYVGQPVEGLYIGSWTTAKILYILSEAWCRTGEEKIRRKARQVFEALRALAQWDGPRAWYMGIAPFRNGKWLMEGWCEQHGRNYPFIVEPLVRYWECTGDEEALGLARAFAEGFLASSQPDMGRRRINPESGGFEGHVHLHTHALWGVAHLGAICGERRYLDWARHAYEFVRAKGTDYGWYPEFIPQSEYRTEICVVGDMVSIAAWLARGGKPHYWDHVERAVRNEVRQSQFFLTPAFLELFHRLHAEDLPGTVEEAVRELRKIEGGFVAQSAFDDWVGYPSDEIGKAGMARNGIHMMGCCPPEGMRALYEAWCGTVEEVGADSVFVNMAFTRDAPAAITKAYEPGAGRLDVTAKKVGSYYIRPPAWAHRQNVRIYRENVEHAVEWGGPADAYVGVHDVKEGEHLTLRWIVPKFTQIICPRSVPECETQLRIGWIGNTVTGVEPTGTYLPMFQDRL